MPFLMDQCPICDTEEANIKKSKTDAERIECPRCGTFVITGSASASWRAKKKSFSPRQIANASSWIWEHQDEVIGSRRIAMLETLDTPSVAERGERLLFALNKAQSHIGDVIELRYVNKSKKNAPWLAASWSIDVEELSYLICEYGFKQKGWIVGDVTLDSFAGRISPTGYDYLEQLRQGNKDSQIGFCAMWFAEEVNPIWIDAIEPAIKDAGYEPIRMDGVQHNNKIDDEILANIRRSRFVVADFTGERGGVYFEAGFALGLGRQVIWTVREDILDKVHFDNRQYNFLIWTPESLVDFRKRLQLRIEATIGRGPI